MSKHNQGFVGIVVAIVVALAIAGGGAYYASTHREAEVSTDATVNGSSDAVATTSVNTEVTMATTAPKQVSATTNVAVSVSNPLKESQILGALNANASTRLSVNGGVMKNIGLGQYDNTANKNANGNFETVKILAKGDLNADGYEDALVQTSNCGMDCNEVLSVILNSKTGVATYKMLDTTFFVNGGEKTVITSATIKNNIITLTGKNFSDATVWDQIETKYVRLQGDALVEIKN